MAVSRSFERKMTKSSPKCVTILASFVRQFGNDFHAVVGLKMAGETRVWHVKVNVYFMKNEPHVLFSGGWQKFMRCNFIFEGDNVQFTLLSNSIFQVKRVSRGGASGNPRVSMQHELCVRRSSRPRVRKEAPKPSA